jgi:DNA-directed RNA polymerase subunit RPC12/RpoP
MSTKKQEEKTYKCFDCGKQVKSEYIRKRIRCPYCGSKILYKERSVAVTVKVE